MKDSFVNQNNEYQYVNTNLVCLGVIASPHGINGAVKIKTFTEKPKNISLYGELISDDNRNYKIDSVFVLSDSLVIATIGGVNSRNGAEHLRNKKLYVERSKLPKLNKNEFYERDLVNMEVRLGNDKLYGYVKSVYNFGSGDVLEIFVNGEKKNVMFSFTKEIFPRINMKRKYITLNIPEFIG
ncbi:MAG: ribosome maturation factor RimM [Wolbachia endosymbiont of Menacanthus eurysternus]|nr:MAG: ribosome maturation factor RimM [Wolbachia endosymbiont of Menacanthus eurysternus]